MSRSDVEQFDDEILNIENPQMQRYLINGEELLPEHDNKYMNLLVDYVERRKKDYHGNIPHDIELWEGIEEEEGWVRRQWSRCKSKYSFWNKNMRVNEKLNKYCG